MIHGPCSATNVDVQCMVKNKCTKHFPHKFYDQTTIDEDGFCIYRRRSTIIYVERKGVKLDNRYVVPYKKRFNCEVPNPY